MAYYSQERKKSIQPIIKSILKEYGIKGSLGVNNHSTVVLNLWGGEIDFIDNFNSVERLTSWGEKCSDAEDYISINPYWFHEHFTGIALEFLKKVMVVLQTGNHDRSDIMTDYFDVGWYVDINIGRWDKPYKLK